jgi:hypothetical protein
MFPMDELNDIMPTREMLDREAAFWDAFALAEKNGANEHECIAAGNRAVDRYDREHD